MDQFGHMRLAEVSLYYVSLVGEPVFQCEYTCYDLDTFKRQLLRRFGNWKVSGEHVGEKKLVTIIIRAAESIDGLVEDIHDHSKYRMIVSTPGYRNTARRTITK